MSGITHANQVYATPFAVFRLWADFWTSQGGRIPPLHHYKNTLNGGFLFVAPLSPPDLAAFLEKASQHPDLLFQGEGSALLDEARWLGHWGCFSVSVRAVRPVRALPPRLVKQPK